MTLSVDKELSVVNLHINALERTLVEFPQPKARAELYAELAKANSRRASLEHQQESLAQWTPAAGEDEVSEEVPSNEVPELLEFASDEEDPIEYIDDDPDLPEINEEMLAEVVHEEIQGYHEVGNYDVNAENHEFPTVEIDPQASSDELEAILQQARSAE